MTFDVSRMRGKMEKTIGSNSQDIKQKNRILILKMIAINRGISRVDIARITGLSKMTVGNLVTELIEDGFVIEQTYTELKKRNLVDSAGSTSGRKPIMLILSPQSPCICGMLIKRKLCQVILGDIGGNIIEQISYDYTTLADGNTLIDMLYSGFKEISVRTDRKIIAVSIASLGPVDSSNGIILNPPYFYNIENLKIQAILEEKIGLPVFLVNDANAGALAEKLYGIGKHIANFAYLHIMNGIGAGFVFKNDLYNGDTGQSGEIGHTSINFAGPLCDCGNRGCLELYANLDNMRQKIGELKRFYPKSEISKRVEPSWKEIVDFANEKDVLAFEALEEFCSYISYALINTLKLLNISSLIIGYDSSNKGYIVEEIVHAKLSESLKAVNFGKIEVHHSLFNGDAPLIGAIAFVADKIFSLNFSLEIKSIGRI